MNTNIGWKEASEGRNPNKRERRKREAVKCGEEMPNLTWSEQNMVSNSIVSYMVRWPSCPCEHVRRRSCSSTKGTQGMQSCSEVSAKGTGMELLHWKGLPNPRALYQMKLKMHKRGLYIYPQGSALAFTEQLEEDRGRNEGTEEETMWGKETKRRW